MDATRTSKLLFGRPARLPLAAWVFSQTEPFFQSQPPTFGTTSKENIKQELMRLLEAEMVRQERSSDGKIWYEKTDSPLWEIVQTAVKVTGLTWTDDRLIEE